MDVYQPTVLSVCHGPIPLNYPKHAHIIIQCDSTPNLTSPSLLVSTLCASCLSRSFANGHRRRPNYVAQGGSCGNRMHTYAYYTYALYVCAHIWRCFYLSKHINLITPVHSDDHNSPLFEYHTCTGDTAPHHTVGHALQWENFRQGGYWQFEHRPGGVQHTTWLR